MCACDCNAMRCNHNVQNSCRPRATRAEPLPSGMQGTCLRGKIHEFKTENGCHLTCGLDGLSRRAIACMGLWILGPGGNGTAKEATNELVFH